MITPLSGGRKSGLGRIEAEEARIPPSTRATGRILNHLVPFWDRPESEEAILL
jgi:hypothetical protein